MTGCRIDWLEGEDDLDGVLDVDRLSFPCSWTREMYDQELRHKEVAFLAVLRTPTVSVAGYCAFRVVADELQINNVAVRPELRGAGYGRALVAFALRHASLAGARNAYLEVRRSNLVAQRLYASMGFGQVGVRPGYYTSPVEDALVMRRDVRILEHDPVA
jgi:[ribosomal protein S18]-alanine N-acetyltransferase